MSLTKILRTWTKTLSGAGAAVDELRSIDQALRQRIAELEAQRSAMVGALPTAAELQATAARVVEDVRRQFVSIYGGSIARSVGGAVAGEPGAWRIQQSKMPEELFIQRPLDLLCILMPDEAAAGLVALAAAAALAQRGDVPPLADRLPRLAALDAEVVAAEQEHAALVDAARAQGIVLEHTDAEQARRNRAAYEADMERRQGQSGRLEPADMLNPKATPVSWAGRRR
jgi:hypothetical protein